MTSLPEQRPGQKKLGLVIDLDICVGCHACATACKEWNASGHMGPLPDFNPYGDGAWGVWFNRIHSFEEGEGDGARTIHFPKSCLHCEEPACVTVCPTGASYKRAEDGIVLVNESICIGCKLCSWACPYGAREFDADEGVMKKCTLCIDRIYNENLVPEDRKPACVMVCPVSASHFGDLGDPGSDVSEMVARRASGDLMPELGYKPVNKYLPPRAGAHGGAAGCEPHHRQEGSVLHRRSSAALVDAHPPALRHPMVASQPRLEGKWSSSRRFEAGCCDPFPIDCAVPATAKAKRAA
jgi:Fe-S-cluster-containing dehydrogenase component